MKQFLIDFLESYAEKFDYTAEVTEDIGLIKTQYGSLGFQQNENDELTILKVKPLDEENEDQRTSLVKIKKHFTGALQKAIARHQEENPANDPEMGTKPAKEPGNAVEVSPTEEETDNLGRPYPKLSDKPPAHFTKPEKVKGGKKTVDNKITPPPVPEPPLPAEDIPGSKAYGDKQRAIKNSVNTLGNSAATMEKVAKAEIGGKKKTDPPDEPIEAKAATLDDIMDGKVDVQKKPAASQPVAAKMVPAQPKAPVVQTSVKQDMAAIQPLSGGFRKAERKKAKLRLGITGPAGSGKTMSALLIASGLVDGDYSKIGIADTENGSANLYVHSDVSGYVIGEYNILTVEPPFEAYKFINAIKMAEESGLEVLILDSISHSWSGVGGFLDKQGKIADKTGNSWAAWRTVSPEHAKFIDTMLQSKIHIIATMRSKTEHVFEGGKVRKVGMAPVVREGMEYEFTIVFDMDQQHNATPTKDRTSMFDGSIFKPVPETGKKIKAWLEIES